MTEQERLYHIGRRIGQLDMALSLIAAEVQRQEQARVDARIAEYKRRAATPTPAPAPPPAPSVQKIGFNTDVKQSFVWSPGANIRIR